MEEYLCQTMTIVALRNEKGSYNYNVAFVNVCYIVALRNEKGSYNIQSSKPKSEIIVALRNEKGSYNAVATMGYAG